MVGLARRELGKQPQQGAYDEEDVALSAFNVFCQGMRKGQFGDLDNRDDLWRLLIVITVRKAHDRAKGALAKKRGGDLTQQDLESLSADEVTRFLSEQTDPQTRAELAEQCQELSKSLCDPELERVALLKLDGHSNAEIAQDLGCTRQTIQRRLRLIREIWKSE